MKFSMNQQNLSRVIKKYVCFLGYFFSHLISISSRMTEEERDQIDTDTQTLIKSCSSAISSLKNDGKPSV